MPVPGVSRDTRQPKSSVSTSRCSIPGRIARRDCLPVPSRRLAKTESSKPRGGGYARMVRSSLRRLSLTPSTRMMNSSASPRLRETLPSETRPPTPSGRARHFRLLVNGVTDYALYMLDPTGVVTNWNAGAQRIKGYRPEEIIGQHFSRFYTNADQAAGRPAAALAQAEQTGRYEEEGWRRRKDGTFFWASVIIDAIRDESGKLLGFAKITRDITERRENQQKLEQMQ